jgi:hypothetical protein
MKAVTKNVINSSIWYGIKTCQIQEVFSEPFKDEEQAALFKDPVRTAQ